MTETEPIREKNEKFSQIKGWLTIEEIYSSGTPVIKICNSYLITASDEYLHKWIKGPKFDFWPDNISRWKESDAKEFSGENVLKDFTFFELEGKANEWSKEISKQ